jgi:hypothetical protein
LFGGAVKEYQLSHHNLQEFVSDIQKELADKRLLIVTTQSADTGKWGMARLWRSWMASVAEFMANNGVTMPLMFNVKGEPYGKRRFNKDDAHELFTHEFLGADSDGRRLSWAKTSHDDMRLATKGERFNALRKMESWATDRGVILLKPRDSEYYKLQEDQDI